MTLTPNEKAVAHGSALGAAIIFLAVAGWTIAPVISGLKNWQAVDEPAFAAAVIHAFVYGLIAGALALGVNFGPILQGLRSLGIPIPGGTAPVAQEEKQG